MSTEGQKPRVCYILPSLNPGGTERQLLYLLEGLRDSHVRTVICTRSGGAWADVARESGATLSVLNTWGGWDFRIGRRAREALHTVRPQILHTFLFGFDLAVCRAARAEGVPVIVSSRRELAAWMKPRHLRAQRKANALVDCIVANSHAVGRSAERREGLDADYIRVIHNGIDADRFVPREAPQKTRARLQIPPERRIVGIVANFSPVKDHALFLSVAGILIHRHDNLHFLLVGDGPLRGEIARATGKSDRFTITSTRDDVASLMNIMDICVLTSEREGFPNVLLEAMALGKPVVAASVGGVPELVEDGVTGLLAHTRRPEEFADAIDRLLNDDAKVQSLGARAADRVREEFSTRRMVEAYRTLYAELLARNPCVKSCAASAE